MSLLNRIGNWKKRQKMRKAQEAATPVVTSGKALGIRRNQLSSTVLKILERLQEAGYEAYLVGGGVRDILASHQPKDFDVVTNATPDQVQGLFRGSLIIGRRFRLVHVRMSGDVIEVATFRGYPKGGWGGNEHEKANVFGTLQSDVWRRDFTVNALYYDAAKDEVIDYVGGVEDIKLRRVRMIGETDLRLEEDPVRVLRALRLAAKLGFAFDQGLEASLRAFVPSLQEISADRLFVEVVKLFYTGHGVTSLNYVHDFGLMPLLFPALASLLKRDQEADALLRQALFNTDRRYAQQRSLNTGFLLAALLWTPLMDALKRQTGHTRLFMDQLDTLMDQADRILAEQNRRVSFPRRVCDTAKEIWAMQAELMARPAQSVMKMPTHPRFRAAYDFLVLRAMMDVSVVGITMWWQRFMDALESDRREMASRLKPVEGGRRSPGREGDRRRRDRRDHAEGRGRSGSGRGERRGRGPRRGAPKQD